MLAHPYFLSELGRLHREELLRDVARIRTASQLHRAHRRSPQWSPRHAVSMLAGVFRRLAVARAI